MGDDMKNKVYKLVAFIFYILSLFILLFCFKVRLNNTIYLYTKSRMLLLALSCLFIYIAGFILVKKLNYTNKILKINLILYFIIYTVTIFTLTLFDEIFGRRGLTLVHWNKEMLNTYIKYSFNIIPFSTIKLFIIGYINNYVSLKNFAINIFGNLFILMPYGMFIPLMNKRVNKYYKFLILMIFFVVVIELLQFVTLSGSCDIDDLILNVSGASIIYFMCKIKLVKKIINKIFLLK